MIVGQVNCKMSWQSEFPRSFKKRVKLSTFIRKKQIIKTFVVACNKELRAGYIASGSWTEWMAKTGKVGKFSIILQ